VEAQLRRSLLCHYCPIGEMLFCLYAWRLLLRNGQAQGFDARCSPGDISRVPASEPAKTVIWPPADLGTPESAWLKYLRSDGAAILPLWREISERLDSQTWASDLTVLGVIAGTGAGGLPNESNRALLNYATYVVKVSGGKHKRLFSQLSALSDTVRKKGWPQRQEDLKRLDCALQSAVLAYLEIGHSRARPTIGDLLRVLHAKARFPVIPYFYWLAIDPCPRSHLVLPVWRATTSNPPVLVWFREPRTRTECITFKNRKKRDLAVVGVGVLAIEPSADFDWTLQVGRRGRARATSCARLVAIREYVELLRARS
jgi:hypothetical protein